MPDTRSLSYLVGTYPMLSMSFVMREILHLRKQGFIIHVASINAPDRPIGALTAEEAAEVQDTYYIKRHGILGALTAHFSSLVRNLPGYLRGLGLAVRLGGADAKRVLMNLAYLSEGLMVGVWMRRMGQRHLHTHLGSQPATVGLFVQRVFGCGFSITVHGPDEFYDTRGQYLAEKVAAADFICCISFYTRSQLMRLSARSDWDKLFVAYLGVDPSVFRRIVPKTASAEFEILCVGRLTPAKGQHVLIEAVGLLVKQGRRVRLRLVGAGVDRPSLESTAARVGPPATITFEGAVNQDRIKDLYASADLFCIPSFAEGLPVVLMEAMAMEIPCVTTHITGIPELIRNGTDGLLVAPGDVDALAAALAKLMDDRSLRDAIGRHGRQRVLENFDLSRNVAKLSEILTENIKS